MSKRRYHMEPHPQAVENTWRLHLPRSLHGRCSPVHRLYSRARTSDPLRHDIRSDPRASMLAKIRVMTRLATLNDRRRRAIGILESRRPQSLSGGHRLQRRDDLPTASNVRLRQACVEATARGAVLRLNRLSIVFAAHSAPQGCSSASSPFEHSVPSA